MSDILIMTLGLLAGVVGCLAKPCGPQQWAHVKAARLEPAAVLATGATLATPTTAGELDRESEPASAPGFADGLAAAAA